MYFDTPFITAGVSAAVGSRLLAKSSRLGEAAPGAQFLVLDGQKYTLINPRA